MFIAFEGSEGTGKSIQSNRLYDELKGEGVSSSIYEGANLYWRKAPGGTEIGDKLREILLDPDLVTISPQAELYMFLADRSQLVHEIKKESKKFPNSIWIVDRYIASTFAYQSSREIPDKGFYIIFTRLKILTSSIRELV